jgi:methylated-DNA-[protein]-cysteine S-methyltransferase
MAASRHRQRVTSQPVKGPAPAKPLAEARQYPVPTRFGTVTVLWVPSGDGVQVRRILLPGHGPVPAEASAAADAVPSALLDLAARLAAALDRAGIAFDLRIADMGTCSPFQRAVLRTESRVPAGRVTTYGDLARRLGRPGGARAVGAALSHNPFPLLVPCHRTVQSDGALGGYQGGTAMKRALLEAEGVTFRDGDRVDLEGCRYGG